MYRFRRDTLSRSTVSYSEGTQGYQLLFGASFKGLKRTDLATMGHNKVVLCCD